MIFFTHSKLFWRLFLKKVPCSHTYMKKCKYKGVDSLIRGLYCIHIVFWGIFVLLLFKLSVFVIFLVI